MLTPQEVTRRRWEKGIKQTILLQHFKNHVINDNNNAKKTQETSGGKSKHKKKCKPKSNCFGTSVSEDVLNIVNIPEPKKSIVLEFEEMSPIFNQKFPDRTTREPVKNSLIEFSVEEVGGELVTINKHHLYSTDDDDEFKIVIRDYLTPDDYAKTVDYYRHINAARQSYLRAALIVGDILQNGNQQRERDEWNEYVEKEEEEKKEWRRNCRRDNQKAREQEIRHSDDEFDIFYDKLRSIYSISREVFKKFREFMDIFYAKFRRIRREVFQKFLREFMDIFPCFFK